MKKIVRSLLLIGMVVMTQAGMSQDYSAYHNYDAMTKELKAMVDANKSIAKIESIGKTLEGHDMWLVTIANPAGVPVDKRPGMFIGASFEGDHLIGSEISLSVINYLLKNYKSDNAVKESIDNHVYYIIPRINPDGAEKMFAGPKAGFKTNTSPFDGDNDGRIDEDGPEDLNKDGYITMMRIKDENGLWLPDKDEPRLMKKADPAKGERGVYTIYWEGIDNDKDGFINEDPVGGTDLNRNFMHDYPYFTENAGRHMVSEYETRALIEWVIKHRNIAIMLNFGESDNLIVPPSARGTLSSDRGLELINIANDSYSGAGKVGMVNTSLGGGFGNRFFMGGGRQTQQAAAAPSGRQRPSVTAATAFSGADLEYFNKVGDMYKDITGIKTQPPLRDPKGAFFQYGYFQFGALSLSTSGWGIDLATDNGGPARTSSGNTGEAATAGAQDRGSRAASPQARVAPTTNQSSGIDKSYLNWLDKNSIKGFVDWKPFKHPDLGEVEIGGFTPYEVNNPPAERINGLGEAHGKFVVSLAGLYAKVQIAKTEVVNHGGGIFRIKAEVGNNGFLPTALNQGVTSRSVKPTMVQLGVTPESIISGNAKTSFFQALAGSGMRQKYEWLIKGKAGDKIELVVASEKAGTDKVIITLK